MNLKVLEKGKDRLKIEVENEDATFLNVLREKAWEAGADQAVFSKRHPYISQPEIIVKASNPKKVLSDAAQLVANQAKDFKQQFNRASKT